jgi:hypothetical protein
VPYLSLTYNALVFVDCLPPGTVTFNDNFNFEVQSVGSTGRKVGVNNVMGFGLAVQAGAE